MWLSQSWNVRLDRLENEIVDTPKFLSSPKVFRTYSNSLCISSKKLTVFLVQQCPCDIPKERPGNTELGFGSDKMSLSCWPIQKRDLASCSWLVPDMPTLHKKPRSHAACSSWTHLALVSERRGIGKPFRFWFLEKPDIPCLSWGLFQKQALHFNPENAV
jgi:hypothetical protein